MSTPSAALEGGGASVVSVGAGSSVGGAVVAVDVSVVLAESVMVEDSVVLADSAALADSVVLADTATNSKLFVVVGLRLPE